MTTTTELLAHLTHLDIKLWADGARLRYDGPDQALTPDVLETMRAHKPALLAALQNPTSDKTVTKLTESHPAGPTNPGDATGATDTPVHPTSHKTVTKLTEAPGTGDSVNFVTVLCEPEKRTHLPSDLLRLALRTPDATCQCGAPANHFRKDGTWSCQAHAGAVDPTPVNDPGLCLALAGDYTDWGWVVVPREEDFGDDAGQDDAPIRSAPTLIDPPPAGAPLADRLLDLLADGPLRADYLTHRLQVPYSEMYVALTRLLALHKVHVSDPDPRGGQTVTLREHRR